MSNRSPIFKSEDRLLFLGAVLFGFVCAAAFGAFRAVSMSDQDAAGRLAEFGANLVWPGVLIFAGVAAVVWMGWKANLD